MASKQMKHLFNIGKRTFYWASSSFMYKGLWMWNGTKNVRIMPLNKFNNWSGSDPEN